MIRKPLPILAISVISLLVVCQPAPAFAQQANGSHAGQRLKAALAQLDLSTAQKQQIKQILEDAKKQRESKSTSSGAAGHLNAGRAVMKQIMSVLTPPQKKKLKQILL